METARPFPFPFLRHGATTAKSLHLWLALADPAADAGQVVSHLSALVPRASFRHEGAVLEVRARTFRAPLKVLDDGLRALHAEAPLGLVVRVQRVKPSEWHRASLANLAAVLQVFERLVRAHQGPYFADDGSLPFSAGRAEDIGRLIVEAFAGRAPVAELIDVTLRCLVTSCTGEARLVLADQLLERLVALLGVSFEVDIVLRSHLARLQGISPGSVPMPPAFAESFATRVRSSHRAGEWRRAPSKLDWTTLAAVRQALTAGQLQRLAGALHEDQDAHAKTLLALEPKELRAMAKNETLALRMSNAAAMFLPAGRFAEALKLYDAAVEGELPAMACANPLYAVQNDNNRLGLDVARSRRYLARCLPRGSDNPTIFLNASFVWMELGEHAEALDSLQRAKKAGVAVKAHRNEGLFAPLRQNPTFRALMR